MLVFQYGSGERKYQEIINSYSGCEDCTCDTGFVSSDTTSEVASGKPNQRYHHDVSKLAPFFRGIRTELSLRRESPYNFKVLRPPSIVNLVDPNTATLQVLGLKTGS